MLFGVSWHLSIDDQSKIIYLVANVIIIFPVNKGHPNIEMTGL